MKCQLSAVLRDLVEAELLAVLSEALSAHVEVVLADKAVLI